ncbi:fasciclin-like arabinogalactan protein 21 [Actinidia eriantha]|uniref:fasciclin-like arabinogalactan protein 21 n=1 Tax=Actinidia eriantha TaxID=165200 RepID=UPI00258BF2F5|nr:fasciclin-like arabinogalactan protein 21 [Actinidia eriantha]XP_057488283.1 fasciclin-like arabinogalactan protein 21 [Actinidia eriantha]
MANSCSNWWHCPLYFSMSVTLAVIAISASIHSTPTNSTPSNHTIFHHSLSFNASRALKNQGFNAVAALLQIYPELFLTSPQSTVFAVPDSSISNVSVHPNLMKNLLKYQISPSNFTIQDLLKKPQNTCLPTLIHQKNIALTKIDPKQRSIEINNVLISHPNLFLDGPISIHGVLGPFSTLNLQDFYQDREISQPAICDAKFSRISNASEPTYVIEWNRIVRFLRSNGFLSFGIRLHSVLDGIVRDYPNLNSATIFAPLDFIFVTPSRPLLDQIVRFHIVPQRFEYLELNSLPEKAILRTLFSDKNLVITSSGYSKRVVAVNGVEIVSSDCFTSKHFVVHGISGAFSMEELIHTSI